MSFLEEVGIVKTARREAESVLLARAVIRREPIHPINKERFLKLAKNNKVTLRAAPILNAPAEVVDEAKTEFAEAMELYDLMSKEFQKLGVSFVVIKSFDSLPDMGHDLDFLLPHSSEFGEARGMLLDKFRVKPQELTHCDKLVGKFSCFLPGFTHDFEIYPTVSQLGEEYFSPQELFVRRIRSRVSGRDVWMMTDTDRVFIRVIHAVYRHNFLKLSDVVDFPRLIQNCSLDELMVRVDAAGMGDSFLFFLATEKRFLDHCRVESPKLDEMLIKARNRFGKDRLGLFERDRLVLPYRISTSGLIILFLFKAGRDL